MALRYSIPKNKSWLPNKPGVHPKVRSGEGLGRVPFTHETVSVPVLSDSFTYTNGPLNGNDGWTADGDGFNVVDGIVVPPSAGGSEQDYTNSIAVAISAPVTVTWRWKYIADVGAGTQVQGGLFLGLGGASVEVDFLNEIGYVNGQPFALSTFSDGQWHNIALQLQGGNTTLTVDTIPVHTEAGGSAASPLFITLAIDGTGWPYTVLQFDDLVIT